MSVSAADKTRLLKLEKRWQTLAAGWYANIQPAQGVGAAPVLVVVGVGAVSAAGLAWAVTAWNYTENLHKETELAADELNLRYSLAQQGVALPQSTIVRPSDAVNPANMLKMGVVGLVAVVGLGFVVKAAL
jgi:hypothetical protein